MPSPLVFKQERGEQALPKDESGTLVRIIFIPLWLYSLKDKIQQPPGERLRSCLVCSIKGVLEDEMQDFNVR